jgi:hypothetical protein
MTEQEMMEAWQKAATPRKEHELLATRAGKWAVRMKHWMAPNAPATEGDGTAEIKMIHGGRQMLEDFKGDFMGMAYEGFGMVGFDNFREEYWQTWVDNMGTSLFHLQGSAGTDGNTATLVGTGDQPARKRKDVPMKSTFQFKNNDLFIFETFEADDSGVMFKNMEIEYKRI